jgi:hypothetical protein
VERVRPRDGWSYYILLHPSNKFLILEASNKTYDVRVVSRDEARRLVEEQGEEFDDFYYDQHLKALGKYYRPDGSEKDVSEL